MEFGLSEEQNLLRDSLNKFLTDKANLDRVRQFADSGDDSQLWQELSALGIPGLLIEEADVPDGAPPATRK